MTTYYVDSNGIYLGGYDGNTGIDTSNYTEVSGPPPTASYTWDGSAWIPPATTIQAAMTEKITYLYLSYQTAIYTSVEFTTQANDTRMYQANSTSQFNIIATRSACPDDVPENFYWVAEDDVKVTPFTHIDVKNLSRTIYNQGWAAFQNLQNKKEDVYECTTVEEVEAITW